jgi:hypothetical protein
MNRRKNDAWSRTIRFSSVNFSYGMTRKLNRNFSSGQPSQNGGSKRSASAGDKKLQTANKRAAVKSITDDLLFL